MSSHIFKIEDGHFALSLADPGVTDVCAATLQQFGGDFNCAIQNGALTASPNVSQETTEATWCAPEVTTPVVGETSYQLDLSYLQDPDLVDGLSRFLFENDAAEAWFYMGMDGDDPPKAVGKLRLVSGAIGGGGRTALTASVSLPLEEKPAVCFGTAAGSIAVNNPAPPDPNDVTDTVFPDRGTAAAIADLTALGSDSVYGDTGSGAPYNNGTGTMAAFATDQYAGIGTNNATQVHWTGSAWAAGPAT